MKLASRGLRRAASNEWWVLTFLLLILSGVLGEQNGLGRADQALYDAALLPLARPPSKDIVIVAIDEPSLDALGRWPWTRTVHAQLLETLATGGPKVVGLDLVFAEAEPGGPDERLARAISASTPVVMPVLMEQNGKLGGIRTTLPSAPLAAGATALGHIHVELDSDGLARSIFLLEGLVESDPSKTTTWPHLALAMLEAGNPAARPKTLPGERNPHPVSPVGTWRRDFWVRLQFAGPAGTYTRYSYVDVLQGKVPASAFRNKYVLVGATAAGLGDAYATPVSGGGRSMPGVEVHANALDNLLGSSTLTRMAPWATACLSITIVLMAMMALRRLSPKQGILLTLGALTGTLFLTLLLLFFGGMWFPPCATLACTAAAYPLWSWRRLEAALTYLGHEFERIDAEPDVLPRATPVHAAGADILEQRIRQLETAASRMRDTRRFVADTLNGHPDGILVTKLDGTLLLANQAAANLMGAESSATLQGRPITELLSHYARLPVPDTDAAWEAIRASAHSGDSTPAVPAPVSQGKELTTIAGRIVAVHCARGTAATGAPLGWIVGLIDVTALRSAEAIRDEALAFLSHDMRSPQSSILALLELHAMDPESHPKDHIHSRIDGYVRKTLNLSEQFLQVSSAETKQYQFETVEVGEICQSAIDDAWDLATKKSIRIQLGDAPSRATVSADRTLLARALANLLSNAIKYSADHTQITISIAINGLEVQLDIADQGYGISPEDQKQLFTRYRRFVTVGKSKAAGAGLGMVFVKTVVERHHGRILVESDLGRGTTVSIYLPLAT